LAQLAAESRGGLAACQPGPWLQVRVATMPYCLLVASAVRT
jgi:hypothetical protein